MNSNYCNLVIPSDIEGQQMRTCQRVWQYHKGAKLLEED